MALTQISTQGIKDGTISSADLADQSVTLAKLPHGTSSNDGKFLRANNGADPTFETVSSIGGSTGVDFDDNVKARFGTGTDLLIYHDGSNSVIRSGGTGQLQIESSNDTNIVMGNASLSETIFKGIVNGAVELYHDNNLKLDTRSSGVGISGNLFMTDSSRLYLGSSNDFELFHDGTNSQIRNATGTLIFRSDNYKFRDKENSDVMATFNHDGAVELYHDNEKKLNTTAGGVVVTGDLATTGSGGTITANENLKIPNDTGKLLLGASNDLQIFHDGSNSIIREPNSVVGQLIIDGYNGTDIRRGETGDHMIRAIGSGAVELYHNGTKKFHTQSSGVTVTGDIDVSNGSIFLRDGERLFMGNSSDFQLIHNGSNSFISNSTGFLDLQADAFRILTSGGAETQATFTANGAVELYHNNNKKFQTESSGVSVQGSVTPQADNLYDLGSSSVSWANIYIGAINFDNSTSISGLVADLWRSTTDHQGNTTPLPNWERADTANQGNISGVSVSSGVFTFPKTGIYLVQFFCTMFLDNVTTASHRNTGVIQVTTNNSDFTTAAQGHVHFAGGGYSTSLDTLATASCAALFDITDTSNQKVRFNFGAGQGHEKVQGNSTINATYATFTLMGDT